MTHKNFTEGGPLGEFLYGWWLWMTLLAALVPLYRAGSQRMSTLQTWRSPPPLTKVTGTLLHVALVLLEAIFVLSCISYGMVKQSDPRNKAQTLLGMAVTTAFLLLFHGVLVAWQLRNHKSDNDAMYDYHSPINTGADEQVLNDVALCQLRLSTVLTARRRGVCPSQLIGGLYGTMPAGGASAHNYTDDDVRCLLVAAIVVFPVLCPVPSCSTHSLPIPSLAQLKRRSVRSTGELEAGRASEWKLFDKRDTVSDDVRSCTATVHAMFCVPPDRSRADSNDTDAVRGANTSCMRPLGVWLAFVSGVIALWTVVFLVLLVWNVVKNHHYFGCVPHVACVDGAWPSS